MADLLLNEPAVGAVLGKVRDVGMPKAMRGKGFRQLQRVPAAGVAGVYLCRFGRPATIGYPQRRMLKPAGPATGVRHTAGPCAHPRPAHAEQVPPADVGHGRVPTGEIRIVLTVGVHVPVQQ